MSNPVAGWLTEVVSSVLNSATSRAFSGRSDCCWSGRRICGQDCIWTDFACAIRLGCWPGQTWGGPRRFRTDDNLRI